jgi:hypothetical protein
LAAAYVINAPKIFGLFWKMLSPFMNDVTKSKLNLLKDKDLPLLHSIIDPYVLEESFGGKNPFKYNFEQHWRKEDIEFPIIPENQDIVD